MSQNDSDDQPSMEPQRPRVGSPIIPTPPAPVAKKTLSDAQKASLARAREKARASKLAKSQAKAQAEEEFKKFQEAQAKPPSPVEEEVIEEDADMTDGSTPTPSPSPVKKRKGKKHRVKKKRRHETSSDDDDVTTDDEEFTKMRMRDHAELAKAAYQNNLARVTSDIVYKSMFPYLG